MAKSAAILAWIEALEFAKQSARNIATDVSAELNLDRLVADPDAHVAFLVSLLMTRLENELLDDVESAAADLAAALGYQDEPDDLPTKIVAVEQIIEDELITAAEAWAAEADARVTELEAEGLSDEVLSATLADGSVFVESITAELASIMGSAAAEAINALGSAVLDEYNDANSDDATLRRWLTVSGSKNPSCDGEVANACEPRHGLVKTMAQWKALGLPNAPNLNCCVWNGRDVCRCILAPVEATTVSPVRAAAAIAAGKTRANA